MTCPPPPPPPPPVFPFDPPPPPPAPTRSTRAPVTPVGHVHVPPAVNSWTVYCTACVVDGEETVRPIGAASGQCPTSMYVRSFVASPVKVTVVALVTARGVSRMKIPEPGTL